MTQPGPTRPPPRAVVAGGQESGRSRLLLRVRHLCPGDSAARQHSASTDRPADRGVAGAAIELDTLEQEASSIAADVPSGLTVAECGRCLLVDGETGERGFCNCSPTQEVIPLESLVGEKMSEQLSPEVVDALVCEVGKRPKDAPTIEEIVAAVTSLQR